MEPDPTANHPITDCVNDCQGHAVTAGNWTKVTRVHDCEVALAEVYQVAMAGRGGLATFKKGAHGVVAVASDFGKASSGNGGVAVSGGGGLSIVESFGYAYSKGGKAEAQPCGVAATAGGYAAAKDHGIAIGWFSNTHFARVEAGVGGVAIGNTNCFVKVGEGGVLIAMEPPASMLTTKICRVGEGGIVAERWYQIQVCDGAFQFVDLEPSPEWPEYQSPCLVPPKP